MKHGQLFTTTLLAGALQLGGAAYGQTARLQVVHNCADLAAAEVDVYVNGALLLDDFAFRTATPFIDVPAGVPLSVAIAPGSSTGVADAIFTQPVTLDDGGSYQVVASGTVSPTGYSPATPFSLAVFADAREAAQGPGTDVLVFHGATDAPTVDVFESAVVSTTIVNDASYGDFAGYLELPTLDFTLQVRTADNSTIVAAYAAPLQTLGLQGAALTVLASGFLNPANNSNGPAFGLWVALPSGGPLVELPSTAIPTARLQAIHNSADLAAAEVDVYLNGALLVDDFAFRTATPFVDVQAGVDLTLSIAPANSTSVADAIANFPYNLPAGGSFILVANGIVSATGYNPATPFDMLVFADAREAAQGPGTDVLVLHGATDAPTVDVFESAVVSTTIVNDASYGDFAGYLELPTLDFTLQVRTADNSTIVAAYAAPLQTLGLQGAALTVLASGFLNPANNSNGPAFGLWVALPSGGPLVELPSAAIPTARLQAIHNSADLAAAEVDVYLNGALLVDDFAFRTATPFVDVQAGVDLTLSIAPGNSTSVADAIANFPYNLPAGGSFILVANGIVSATGYNPATPFDMLVFADAREAAQGPGTDVLVLHGATDAPTVDVGETAVLAGATIVDDISYGEFDGYLEIPAADYVLEVRTSDGTPIVAYQAPLSTLGLDGAAITVLASGFLAPANNSNGPGFGLWVALASGGPLVELPLSTGVDELNAFSSVNVWPNPATESLFIDLNARENVQASIVLADATGRVVRNISSASIASGESRIALDVNGLAGGLYHLNILGANSNRSIPVSIVR
ncbi:MAG: DUF4397 domain-containing protein [Flavobacteriales bacterium]